MSKLTTTTQCEECYEESTGCDGSTQDGYQIMAWQRWRLGTMHSRFASWRMNRASQEVEGNGEGHVRRRDSICKGLKVRDGTEGQVSGRGQVILAFGIHDKGVWTLKGFRQLWNLHFRNINLTMAWKIDQSRTSKKLEPSHVFCSMTIYHIAMYK